MFNDERINIECGKIYSKGILLTVLVTLLYTISRTITLIIQGEFKTPITYTEAVILILGIGILLTGFFRFNKDRDERTVYERHTFYKKAAKRFVIAVFATYILTIPFTTQQMLGGQPHNHLLILLEVLGFLYIFYTFKTKEININYSFIYDDNRSYYRKVFSNVRSLCLWLLLPFVIAATFELIAHQSFSGALTILIAYTSSAIGLSIAYVFISMIEKTSYNNVNSTQFTLGTKISMTVCLGVELFLAVIYIIFIRLVSGNIQNIGSLIAHYSQQRLRVELILTILIALTVCHIMSQVKRGALLHKVCRIEILFLVLSTLQAILMPVWYRAISDEGIVFLVNYIDPWVRFISYSFSIVLWILFVVGMVRELRAPRILWAIPIAHTVIMLTNMILTSQSMSVEATLIESIIKICYLSLLTVTIWKYNRFTPQNEQ